MMWQPGQFPAAATIFSLGALDTQVVSAGVAAGTIPGNSSAGHFTGTSFAAPTLSFTSLLSGESSESGAVTTNPNSYFPNPFSGSDMVLFNLTNLATNQKRAIHCYNVSTVVGGVVQQECINAWQYSTYTASAGAETSTIYAVQTGGGNALSLYNLCAQRPTGYYNWCTDANAANAGVGIELGVDGPRVGLWSYPFNDGASANATAVQAQWIPNNGNLGLWLNPTSGGGNTADSAIKITNASGVTTYGYVDGWANAKLGGIWFNQSTTTPTVSACGSGTPSLSGASTNYSGTVTVGTGTVTTCTLTFVPAFKSSVGAGAVVCGFWPETTIAGFGYSYIKTGATFNSTGNMAGINVDYMCTGQPGY